MVAEEEHFSLDIFTVYIQIFLKAALRKKEEYFAQYFEAGEIF